MATLPIYTITGDTAGTHELSDAVFAVPVNHRLLHRLVTVEAANNRVSIAHTKMRSEVRGGGRKPWKQKGTGRARAGSSRSPIWRGGGITFGPRKDRVFGGKINKKEKQAAMRMVLSDLVASDRLVLMDAFVLPAPKTKELATVLAALPTQGKVLIVSEKKDDVLVKTSGNLPNVEVSHVGELSPSIVLKYATCVMTVGAADVLAERLLSVVKEDSVSEKQAVRSEKRSAAKKGESTKAAQSA